MITETIYHNSPLGVLEISSNANAITNLTFINSWKGKKIVDTDIIFSAPKSAAIQNCIFQLNEFFNGKRFVFDIATTQSGTAFQQTVWRQLKEIKYGNTISYLHLSKQIGDVKAIRAVGTANGKNNIAIIIPCHRVIGSNGDLIGYAGDLWRKKWLLEHEAKHAFGVQTLF